MKPQGVIVIFLFGVMGLIGAASGLCLVRETGNPDRYWYQCFMSTDYSADLKKAPIDIWSHSVTNSKIKVIRNGSYARFNKTLTSLAVLYCGVEEIEDEVFRGLTNLKSLMIVGNKLEVIKSSWVEGLVNLKDLSFYHNRIKRVDDRFFSILPRRMNQVDVANNQLTCLPTASFGDLNPFEFRFRHNRLTWKCQVQVMEWFKNTRIETDISTIEPPYELAEMCISKHPESRHDGELLDKCIEDTTHTLLPPGGDYNVKKVCQFLKGKPSPFLDCDK